MAYESDNTNGAPEVAAPADKKPEVPAARTALVEWWITTVKDATEHWKDEYEKMRKSMRLARDGHDDENWVKGEKYVVPVLHRVINQAVATLYARNPKAVARRKKKLYYKMWDGDPMSLAVAQQALAAPALVDQFGAPMVDPMAKALIDEVMAAKQQMRVYDLLGQTMEILFGHYLDEQDNGYKEEFKAWVRRAKVNGAAYVKLGFQRQVGRDADVEARIADARDQLDKITAGMEAVQADEWGEQDRRREELKLMITDLQQQVEIILREGPVLSFPQSTSIIPDKDCRNLKTFSGSRWVAHQFDMAPERVKARFKVDLKKGEFREYTAKGARTEVGEGAGKGAKARLWEVQDKENGQQFIVCDGYCDFIKEPSTPDVQLERFWTIFSLVFNQTESEDSPFSLSDPWAARHMQREYCNANEGRREHRTAARPRYMGPRGKLEEEDKSALSRSEAHSFTEINGMVAGDEAGKLIQRVPTALVDPALYETETISLNIQRVVGAQDANIGPATGATATETSIAENSRLTTSADNTDDLDTCLTALARAMGQLMLLELSPQTVQEIVGPGAVWPTMRPTREQIVKDLYLSIEAGSSGRPNSAAELANLDRAIPHLALIPGINPTPLAKKYAAALDINVEDLVVEGLPSITAMNQMAGRNMQAGGGPNDPTQQGDQGAANAPDTQRNEPQSQPAFPAPANGLAPAVGA